MRFRHWEPVPLSTLWRQAEGNFFLVLADGRDDGYVLEVGALDERGQFVAPYQGAQITTLRYASTRSMDHQGNLEMLPSRPIGPRVREFVGAGAFVVAIPPIKWGGFGLLGRRPTRILNPGEYQLDGNTIVEYAKSRLAGNRPTVRRHEDRRAAALRRADEIKAEYGELLSDIVYRIDHPALFDTAVPATEQFQVAMVRLDNALGFPLEALEDAVNELEISYSLARDHAETVGAGHLPEDARDAARRASKAARLAASATTEGEREASLTQVRRILGSLALYYLPTIEAETLSLEAPGSTTTQDPPPTPGP